MFIEWGEIFSVSNGTLDAQHKQIVKRMNDLLSVLSSKSREQTIKKSIVRLRSVLEIHFRYEEALMKYSSFPEYENHRQMHRTLLIRTAELFDKYEDKTVSISEIIVFIKEWWLRHIINDDREYIECIAELEL